jgi:anti-sigma factor (TIGR02949 family)
LTCKEVIRQISEYLDAGLDAETRQRLEDHFAGCQHCKAILDGARNVIRLVGDDRVFELPAQFGVRLRERLKSVQPR